MVIDNGGPEGDAILATPGMRPKVGPVSTVSGAAILNAVIAEAVGRLMEMGIDPPVLMSANVEGSDVHNLAMLARYQERRRASGNGGGSREAS